MNRPTVSVIIPTFNAGSLVGEAVASALAQTVPPAQVIVIDDGSTDDTRDRLAPFGTRITYVHQANAGVAAARNHGIRLATGEFIAFLDADDVWHPRKLELQLAVMAENPAIALLGTEICDWPAEPFPQMPAEPPRPRAVSWRALAVRNRFTTSSIFVRRSALDEAGTFDEALRGPEDYDLWLRIARIAGVANLDLPLTGYRTVTGSLGRQAETMEAGLQRILQKLDDTKAWGSRRLLRRKAYSFCDYSCAYLHATARHHDVALRRLLRSFAWYPLPYRRGDVRLILARPRMLSMILRRLRRPETHPAAPREIQTIGQGT